MNTSLRSIRSGIAATLAAITLGSAMLAPITATAQDEVSHRQKKKNEWRNIGTGAGVVGLIGLLKGDSTLMFAGGAGALYSAYRYEQDRKSQSKSARARAAMFSKKSFYRNGHKYVRKTVHKDGKTYYQFVKVS